MRRFWLSLVLIAGSALPAHALESKPVTSPRAVVTLITESDTATPGQTFQIGLRLRMAPGWHTYWKNPGDAGQAASVDLTLPPGVRADPIAWPAPRVQREGELATFGYSGELLLPIRLSVPKGASGALDITAQASWLVCERICVPESGAFHLSVPTGAAKPSAEAPLFAAGAAEQPREFAGTAELLADGRLILHDRGLPRALHDAFFIPEQPGRLDNAAPQALTVEDGTLTLKLPVLPGKSPAPLPGVLLLHAADGRTTALAVTATPAAAAPAPVTPLIEVLAGAFLAGLILNLMPCVFPVLAMKALAVVRLSGAARGRVRAHAVSYTLGVLVAFAALAGAMLGLRAAGGAAGWGFQFQSPVFVAGMAWLMFGVGLSLSGVFSIGGSLSGTGQGLAGRGGHFGSFFTGLLAVVVATPCTAPFMAAALAAALAAPAPVMVSVFLAMGLGLAGPYLLLACLPHLGVVLPRPGRWMDIMKQGLAFPMYGATAWLIWVLSEEAGSSGVLAGAAGLVLLGFAAWAFSLAQLPLAVDARGHQARGGRRIAQASALAACLAAMAVLSGIAALPAAAIQTASDDGAEPFTAARLATLRAQGKPVFVNMTAAWCITCLLNERVALAPPSVGRAFAEHGITYLRGDWTRQDPEITAFLRDHARDGVPLYVFYPAGGGPAEVLPQILTEHTVLERISADGA